MKKKQLAISITYGLLTYGATALAQGSLDIYAERVYFTRNDIDKTQLVEKTKDPITGPSKNLEFKSRPSCCNRFGLTSGYRVGVIYATCSNCLEINYLHTNPWKGKKNGDLASDLIFGNMFEEMFDGLTKMLKQERVIEGYHVDFCAAEANYCYYLVPTFQNYFSLAALVGFHCFRLEEKLQRSLCGQNNALIDRYFIHVRNDMYGLQIGCLLQSNPDNGFYWSLNAKAGAMANNLRLERSLEGKKESIHPGVFTEAHVQAGWNLARWIKLYMGYEMLFLYGIGTAPEQIFQKKCHVYHNNKTIFHGISGGIAFTF